MENKDQKTKLCILRDIFRFIREFETEFQEKHDLCLNEGMALCSLREDKMSASELANKLILSPSNMSKVIKSIEEKGLIKRILGTEDKRQMHFTLSKKGEEKIEHLKNDEDSITSALSLIYQTQEITISQIY